MTTTNPVPQKELNLLKPLVPILTPDHLNQIMEELVDMQLNLNNYLINQQINMTQQMLSQLDPRNAQETLTQINQAIADLSGVSIVVDEVEDFFEDVFGW